MMEILLNRRAFTLLLCLGGFLLLLALLTNCGGGGDSGSSSTDPGPLTPAPFPVTLQVLSEEGQPITGASAVLGADNKLSGSDGQVSFEALTGPSLVVVSASDYLSEPIVLGPGDANNLVAVTLRSKLGGLRWVLHASGDVMFGRRYENPTSGEPQIPTSDPASGALSVIKHIKDAFRAADLSTVNLETTVSNLPESLAYPGKRFILNARPETMAALQALAVDAVVLANNHTRDYKEPGLQQTIDAMNGHQLAFTGASVNDIDAYAPLTLTVGSTRIGILSWTSVTGSFVNDNYPTDEDAIPADLSPAEAWQYELRIWSYSGASWSVPAQAQRIGTAWNLYKEAESSLSDAERVAAWRSLTTVYPEMQDWVARRGHGGAALWSSRKSPATIEALKESVDAVIVQLHSGFQYQEAPSTSVKRNARLAIDAGADIVICHHPHVLQGVEWYKDRLIVYSLGNFIFDQDFLVTFPSAFVRVIWQGNVPIEAQLVPFEIVNYRPALVYGSAAERTLLHIWESSLMQAESARDPADNAVKAFVAEPDADTTLPNFTLQRNIAVLTAVEPMQEARSVTLAAGETYALNDAVLLDARLGFDENVASPVLIGRDLFGRGSFEDWLANEDSRGGIHWGTAGTRKQVIVGDAASGEWFLQLTRFDSNQSAVLIRPVARVPLKTHRIYELQDNSGLPLDPVPSYSLRFMARMEGTSTAAIRLDVYDFDDTDPTADPESELIASITEPFALPADGAWHQIDWPIPESALKAGPLIGDMVNFYFVLEPPSTGRKVTLDIDDVAFVEWRQASAMPQRFGQYEFIHNPGEQPVDLSFQALRSDRF
ncbi:MAG: CapA family protein [Candidatus Thiodiazotropha sp. (ex Troendleina suluensis)]|nr:CapA family protein [Candidatus Thiodiazotropha sp. (ex Troendleina suluensis)]